MRTFFALQPPTIPPSPSPSPSPSLSLPPSLPRSLLPSFRSAASINPACAQNPDLNHLLRWTQLFSLCSSWIPPSLLPPVHSPSFGLLFSFFGLTSCGRGLEILIGEEHREAVELHSAEAGALARAHARGWRDHEFPPSDSTFSSFSSQSRCER